MPQNGNNSAEGRNNNGNGSRQPAKDDGPKVNDGITAPKVRLVGDNIPQPGIYPLREALRLAESLELDLVEISAKVDPPVCKIIDYQKYVYQQKKKAKEMKSNASKVVIKEIRFGPNTDEHDFQFKLRRMCFSEAAPSSSPSRARSSCCVSPSSSRSTERRSRCRDWRARG